MPQHLEYLVARGIDPDFAYEKGVRSFSRERMAELLRRPVHETPKTDGLGIPYDEDRSYWRFRLVGWPGTRFLSPRGRTRPYLTFDEVHRSDKVLVVEGAFKALALISSRHHRDRKIIGLGGCCAGGHDRHNYRRNKVALLSRDLRRFSWEGVNVYILLDSNKAWNTQVILGERILKEAFQRVGALVYCCDLPHAPPLPRMPGVLELPQGPRDQGPDDFLAEHGEAALQELLDSTPLAPFDRYLPRDFLLQYPITKREPAGKLFKKYVAEAGGRHHDDEQDFSSQLEALGHRKRHIHGRFFWEPRRGW